MNMKHLIGTEILAIHTERPRTVPATEAHRRTPTGPLGWVRMPLPCAREYLNRIHRVIFTTILGPARAAWEAHPEAGERDESRMVHRFVWEAVASEHARHERDQAWRPGERELWLAASFIDVVGLEGIVGATVRDVMVSERARWSDDGTTQSSGCATVRLLTTRGEARLVVTREGAHDTMGWVSVSRTTFPRASAATERLGLSKHATLVNTTCLEHEDCLGNAELGKACLEERHGFDGYAPPEVME